jgi:TPR repeat protein
MLAERRKLSVTRISRSLVGAAALVAALASAPGFAARGVTFSSPQAAFEQGLGALKAGHVELALPALEHAASKGMFLAEFYLARVFADNAGAYTDHARAFKIYQRIADEYADIDPVDDQSAPFVAKAFTALAGYLLRGIPELRLKPNPQRAAEYLDHAANFFNDHDAQFELAKLYLTGEGVPTDARRAVHWLSVLTEKGHAGAQAFLADLYWRGRHVAKDSARALALITLALENAPAHERIWIEDIHQNIFCGAGEGIRQQADGLVADWRRHYVRTPITVDRHGLAPLQIGPVRTCSNGEPVRAIESKSNLQIPSRSQLSTSAMRSPDAAQPMARGGVLGLGMRDASETVPAPGR